MTRDGYDHLRASADGARIMGVSRSYDVGAFVGIPPRRYSDEDRAQEARHGARAIRATEYVILATDARHDALAAVLGGVSMSSSPLLVEFVNAVSTFVPTTIASILATIGLASVGEYVR